MAGLVILHRGYGRHKEVAAQTIMCIALTYGKMPFINCSDQNV